MNNTKGIEKFSNPRPKKIAYLKIANSLVQQQTCEFKRKLHLWRRIHELEALGDGTTTGVGG